MSKKSEKLLEKLRRSAANATRADLDRLYTGFGFEITSGSKHDKVRHPKYPQLRTLLPRHTKLAVDYFETAIELIDALKQLIAEEENE